VRLRATGRDGVEIVALGYAVFVDRAGTAGS